MIKAILMCYVLLAALTVTGQTKWKPYIGIHATGDAEMYYIGPSFQLGIDYNLNNRFTITSYAQYFNKRIDRVNADGSFEKAHYRTVTGAVLLQAKINRFESRNDLFIAGGVAVQPTLDDFSASWYEWYRKRSPVLPAVRFGYAFPVLGYKLATEINATGPYSYQRVDNGSIHDVLEIVTQISLGCRVLF